MGQKVNPISLRLEKTNRHFDSCWYDDYNYTDLLLKDLKIKNYFKSVLNQIKYPEGRILIENLPKKSNINLFYCNPSNSRRKKNPLFQLQDVLDAHKKKNNRNVWGKKNKVYAPGKFFSFPEQKYWNIEKSSTFTLAQQGLEEWKNSVKINDLKTLKKSPYALPAHTGSLHLYNKNVQCDENKGDAPFLKKQNLFLHKNTLFYSLSDLIQTEKTIYKIDTEKRLYIQNQKIHREKKTECILREHKQTKEYSKIKQIMDKKSYTAVFFSPLCQAQGQPLYQNIDPFVFFRQNKHNLSQISPLLEECGKDNTLSKREQGKSIYRLLLSYAPEKKVYTSMLLKSKILTTLKAHRKTCWTLLQGHRNKYSVFLGHNNITHSLLQFVIKKRENNKRVEEIYTSMLLKSKILTTLKAHRKENSSFKFSDFNSLSAAHRKQDTDKKWVVERFFVRYLLARLYGEFLQNKSVYSQENLRTLCQFTMFFQEKNKKQKNETENKENSSIKISDFNSLLLSYAPSSKKELLLQAVGIKDSKKPIGEKLGKYGPLSGKQDMSKKVQTKDSEPKAITKFNTFTGKNPEKRKVVPRLYSSNKVYKSHLESFLCKQYNSFFNLHLFRTLIEKQGALFLVQEIIYYLERKIPFRRIKTHILREIPRYKHIKGVRMTCSGRVGGRSKKAQRSKTQSVKIGQTPLGVFSSKIDFASKSALTRFGLVGVKVWVCYQ